MLRTLLESKAVHARRTGGTVVSVGVHTAVIALAIVATARATSAPPRPPVQPPQPVEWIEPVTIADPAPPVIREPSPVPNFPVPTRLVLPEPTKLPSIDGFDGKIDEREMCCTYRGPLDPGPAARGLGSPIDSVFERTQVEMAAAPRPGNPAPAYPTALRAAQIEGTVVARFVVDTSGLAEPKSITFPEATHSQFAEAVRESLLRSRYLPAMIAGHRVRQLVEQHFAFTLTR